MPSTEIEQTPLSPCQSPTHSRTSHLSNIICF